MLPLAPENHAAFTGWPRAAGERQQPPPTPNLIVFFCVADNEASVCKILEPFPSCHVLLHSLDVFIVMTLLKMMTLVMALPRSIPAQRETRYEHEKSKMVAALNHVSDQFMGCPSYAETQEMKGRVKSPGCVPTLVEWHEQVRTLIPVRLAFAALRC